MTCLEKYMLEHPNVEDSKDIVLYNCPHWSPHAYLNMPDYCRGTRDGCEKCWNREIPEETTPVCDCYDPEYERCNGTKERDKCSCNGIESQCDFYPEKRGETKKKTIVAHMPPFDTVEDSVSEATKSEEENEPVCRKCWYYYKFDGATICPLCVNYDKFIHLKEAVSDTPKILDSGNRREFETGAVRDIQEGKGRCDLMPLDVVAWVLCSYSAVDTILHDIYLFQMTGDASNLYYALGCFIGAGDRFTMILEVSKHFEEGAKKYGEHNWQKGIPTNCYIDSAVRHYLKFLRGDTDENHDRAFVWNILCCIWTCKHKPELNVYRKENDET